MREPQAICLWLFSHLQHKFKVKGFQRYSSLDTQYLQQSPKLNGFVDGPVWLQCTNKEKYGTIHILFVACMKHVLYSEEYIYYLQLKRYKCLSKLGRVLMLWSKGILPPTGFADFSKKQLTRAYHAQNRPSGLNRCFAAVLLMRRRSFLAQYSEKTCKHVLF